MRATLLLVCLAVAAADDREWLLNPRALARQPVAETEAQLRKSFADPPAEYRSMPLWVWNDELAWPRLREQLGQFRQQGIGGVFVHPRPGLMTEYLGEEWFRLWGRSLAEGQRLGLLVNIYDENSYPAGFAGGHVPARAPDTVVQFVEPQWDPPRIPWTAAETVAVFAVKRDAQGALVAAERVRSHAEIPAGRAVMVFRLRRASGNPWTAGFPYVDLTNPQTAPHFIETTLEPYRQRFAAEFGQTLRWAFDDEPLLATGGAYDQTQLALPLSFHTLAEFRRRCGYELADHLPALYWDVGEFRRVRFDYWQTLHDLFKENYFRPLFEWCDRNSLQLTGHPMEHEWPYPWITPANGSMYAYEHVPGIDMLEGAQIRARGADPHMLFTIKEVASVARQLGRRALCEAYGVAGWDSTFEHYKRLGDWLMVHGIDFLNQHLAFSTVRGARKRDHPQSFTDVSPWWPYYQLHGDHLGRACYLLGRGAARHRVLVLLPTTSAWLWARRAGATPELEKMRRQNAELIQFLADRQVDFDLGDEYMLEWFGAVEGRRLKVGRAAYDVVIWPPNLTNVRRQFVPLLEKYLAAGGPVLALAPPAAYVDGRPSRGVEALRERYGSAWHAVSGLPELPTALGKHLEPRVRFDRSLPQGVGFAERFLEDGTRALFFANTGLQPVAARATVEGGGLEAWDTATGSVAPARFEDAGSGRLAFDLDLPPAGSEMLVVKKTGTSARARPEPRLTRLEPRQWKVTPVAPNVLVLDYCDLAVAGQEHRDVNTWRANWAIWRAHGFERPAWDNAVQFKTRIFDRNRFDASSGFEATFRCEVADAAALRSLELAIESPELYRVTLNGTPVSFEGAARWLDPHLRSAAVGQWAKTGENVIQLTGRPFDVRMELENIYLRGDFAVLPAEKGFRLGAPRRLGFGSWAGQGFPCYGDAVAYETEVEVPAGAERLRVELGAWEGSVAEVLLDSRPVARLGWPPYVAECPAVAGRHKLVLKVVSTPRNVFGPFHNPTHPRMRAWPAAWAEFPERQPAGAAYDVLDYGLMKAPVINALSR